MPKRKNKRAFYKRRKDLDLDLDLFFFLFIIVVFGVFPVRSVGHCF